ncbi:MAG: hypothetical protein A2Y33_10615 [Spirochaetes bacterium GWF1_51_8]|nr:MAG: hypothetical protein A2Y33_10615 [Spirochaetes bacterium GWF1_51_8]
MRRIAVIVSFLLLWGVVSAYENNMANMSTPSEFIPGQMEFEVSHHLYDRLENIGVSGLFNAGAEVALGFRACVLDNFIPYLKYINDRAELIFGLNYSIINSGSFIRAAADLSLFTYIPGFGQDRQVNFFFLVALQTVRLGEFLSINLNLGYDNFNQAAGGALGADMKIAEPFHILLEYGMNFAVPAGNPNIGKTGYFSLGFKFATSGHHFMFVFQNTPDTGMRNLLLGAPSLESWYFGFTIQRMFDLT